MDAREFFKLTMIAAQDLVLSYNKTGQLVPQVVAIVDNPGELPAVLHVSSLHLSMNPEEMEEALSVMVTTLLSDTQILRNIAPQSLPDSEVVGVLVAQSGRVRQVSTGQGATATADCCGYRMPAPGSINIMMFPRDGHPMSSAVLVDPVSNIAQIDFTFQLDLTSELDKRGPMPGVWLH